MASEQNRGISAIAGVATLNLTVGTATVSLRAYMSSHHLWAAQYFAQSAAGIENEPGPKSPFDIRHRTYVSGAILSAIAFGEAAINELLKDVVDAHGTYSASIDQEASRQIKTIWSVTEVRNRSPFSILDKYQMVLRFCRKHEFETGTKLYQDADLAIKLRNELTHYKPNSYGGDTQHKFSKQLLGKFPENPLMAGNGNPFFPDKCLGSPCARWVTESMKALTDDFFERLGIIPNYQIAKY